MPRRFGCLLLSLVVLASPQPAAAVNLFFMPGDAFFSASLSEESAAALPEKGGTLTLKHHWLHSDWYLCGYGGFQHLEIRDVPPEQVAGLKTIYRELRRLDWPRQALISYDANGKEVRSEENPFHLFVYDKSFDPARHSFGLKYNDGWSDPPLEAMREPAKGFGAGSRFPAIKYEKFIEGEAAVVLDWKDGPKVPSLSVEVPPDAKWASMGPEIVEPAVAKASDVRFFVLPHESMQKIHERQPHEHFWEVTPTGFRRYWFRPDEEDHDVASLEIADIPFEQPARLSAFDEYFAEDEPAESMDDQPEITVQESSTWPAP